MREPPSRNSITIQICSTFGSTKLLIYLQIFLQTNNHTPKVKQTNNKTSEDARVSTRIFSATHSQKKTRQNHLSNLEKNLQKTSSHRTTLGWLSNRFMVTTSPLTYLNVFFSILITFEKK